MPPKAKDLNQLLNLMRLEYWKDIATIVGAVLALAGAGWALYEYHVKLRLERAKWLASLYEKFYERENLKPIREILDCEDEISLEITRLIRDEPAEFTDYLNFFEFVAFLGKLRQLGIDEINDLFGYYLDCIGRRDDIKEYIGKRGYELLVDLLAKRSVNQK